MDLKDKTVNELEQVVGDLGGRNYLAGYVFQFIHAKNVADVSQITPLSMTLRKKLSGRGYHISQLTVADKLTDDQGTTKYLFELGDGRCVETVLLIDGKRSHGDLLRRTLCISTQAGCAMDCRFCATAKIGFDRNLTGGEIVDQVNVVWRDVNAAKTLHGVTTNRISNVVFMGMGEPLANYDAVIKSVAILNHPKGKNIGIRHITVSTCGIVPAIRKLAHEDVRPRLAVSLNAPTNEIRTKLMPINGKYPIAELFKAVRFYQARTRQRVTFEYVMIKGLNDSTDQAGLLVKLLKGIACNVNLIEHNPHPHSKYQGSSGEQIRRFASILQNAGIETVVRFKMGRSIRAACGQLGADWLVK